MVDTKLGILKRPKHFSAKQGISEDGFDQLEKYSHANIFHSVMGALSASSDVYRTEFDIYFQGREID